MMGWGRRDGCALPCPEPNNSESDTTSSWAGTGAAFRGTPSRPAAWACSEVNSRRAIGFGMWVLIAEGAGALAIIWGSPTVSSCSSLSHWLPPPRQI